MLIGFAVVAIGLAGVAFGLDYLHVKAFARFGAFVEGIGIVIVGIGVVWFFFTHS
jgi:hypothetical protein